MSSSIPALVLLPLDDTFVPKQLSLSPENTRVKIGRQTSTKTLPSATNGYFDSKVLSRTHAEAWADAEGRVFLQDVKSSNGTFVNGQRLAPELEESAPWQIFTNDVIEFGIDIISEETKAVLHHKVSAKAYVVGSQDDLYGATREIEAWYRSMPEHSRGAGGHHAPAGHAPGDARLTGTHFPGGALPHPVVSFEDIYARLVNEVQRAHDVNQDMLHLKSTLTGAHDALTGASATQGDPIAAAAPVRPSLWLPADKEEALHSASALGLPGAPSRALEQQQSSIVALQQVESAQNAALESLASQYAAIKLRLDRLPGDKHKPSPPSDKPSPPSDEHQSPPSDKPSLPSDKPSPPSDEHQSSATATEPEAASTPHDDSASDVSDTSDVPTVVGSAPVAAHSPAHGRVPSEPMAALARRVDALTAEVSAAQAAQRAADERAAHLEAQLTRLISMLDAKLDVKLDAAKLDANEA